MNLEIKSLQYFSIVGVFVGDRVDVLEFSLNRNPSRLVTNTDITNRFGRIGHLLIFTSFYDRIIDDYRYFINY